MNEGSSQDHGHKRLKIILDLQIPDRGYDKHCLQAYDTQVVRHCHVGSSRNAEMRRKSKLRTSQPRKYKAGCVLNGGGACIVIKTVHDAGAECKPGFLRRGSNCTKEQRYNLYIRNQISVYENQH
jgi:hypothetical protein